MGRNMGLLETAAATLIGGERKIDVAARNVTNVNTPAYKREVSFTSLIADSADYSVPPTALPQIFSIRVLAQSPLMETGKALDLAINGDGFLLLRDGDRFALSRGGQFDVGQGGTLVDPLGRIVQQATGGDLVIGSGAIDFLTDGTVLEDGSPIGSVGIFEGDTSDFGSTMTEARATALAEAPRAELRQGMLERSNVTLSDEMVELMRAQRQVESGAQMVRAYDRLMNQAVTTFSRSS